MEITENKQRDLQLIYSCDVTCNHSIVDVTTNYEYVFDRLYMMDVDLRHTTFSLWCQCPRDLDSAPAEKGEVGGFQYWAQISLLLVGLAVESRGWHWVGHFSRPCMNRLTKLSSGHVGPPFSGGEAVFSVYRGDHWPRTVTIESTLKSGCGLSHESAQDSYNSTCKTSLMPRPYAHVRERVWLHKSKSLGLLQNLKASNEIAKQRWLE